MKGSISVESTVGKGSKFIIKLPGIAIASIAPSDDAGEWIESNENTIFSSDTILVVDDIPSNRDMIATLLTEAGLTVVVAQNGQVAIDLVKEKMPACIIMDILMPVLDGVSAAKIIKQSPATASIPIIALTTLSNELTISEEELTLCSGRLSKPVTSHELLDELKKHIPCVKDSGLPTTDESKSIEQEAEIPVEYYNKARDLLGAVKMDDVRVFAQEMVGFGRKNRLPGVRKIGKKLAEHADHFDITGVRKILRELVN
jgi:two-component system sensor histidine kinase EvgS